jgi:non-homologous end joining protein Ku
VSKPAATNVVNLMDVLQRSLEASKSRRSRGESAADEDEADEKPAKRGGSKAKKTASAAKPKRKKSAA